MRKKYFIAGAALAAGGLMAVALGDLTVFKPGEPIRSAEVNQNFSALRAAIEAPLTPGRIADGAVTLPKLAVGGAADDGKVLKLQGGLLAWADDLLGGGGAAYSAGPGLSLLANTFSLADGGVTAAKLAAKPGADGQVLKLRGRELTWAGDETGGGAYSADGQSLQLAGAVFSVRDGGIGSAKLGGGAVTSDKLRVPLRLISAGDGAPPLTISTPDVGLRVETRGGTSISAQSAEGEAVRAVSNNGPGLHATSISQPGVFGYSAGSDGVQGRSTVAAGLYGESQKGSAVVGIGREGYAAEFSGGRFGRGICYFAGGSGWSCTSDVNAKENFREVDPHKILEALVDMPITAWNMKGDAAKTPHLGPTAQDFRAAFGLGRDDKTINAADAQGVAMAAIQGLYQEVVLMRVRDGDLRAKLAAAEARIRRLEGRP